jgi:hypothetical protein
VCLLAEDLAGWLAGWLAATPVPLSGVGDWLCMASRELLLACYWLAGWLAAISNPELGVDETDC